MQFTSPSLPLQQRPLDNLTAQNGSENSGQRMPTSHRTLDTAAKTCVPVPGFSTCLTRDMAFYHIELDYKYPLDKFSMEDEMLDMEDWTI